MASYFLSIIILMLTYYFSSQKNIESHTSFLFSKLAEQNPDYSNLKEWLNQLVVDIPNELIENLAQGLVDSFTLYDLNLDNINTTSPETIDNKIGINISVTNIGLSFTGMLRLFELNKQLNAHVSRISILLPINLIRDSENGLITKVDTSGLNIELK